MPATLNDNPTRMGIWQLKKTALCIGLIVLLELGKILMQSRQHLDYYYYAFNMLSCYQLLILLFAVFSIILELVFKKFFEVKRWRSVIFFLSVILVAESVCTYLLYHPKLIPGNAKTFIDYYFEFDCKLIQYQKVATEYDREFFYKLRRSNSFVYSNREFADSFRTNSMGFRDQETSLHQPAMLFLGDSYTLGWGARQDETFKAVTEKLTGLRGLNAGMSSYGTAREAMILPRIDKSALKWIVWQYCNNDVEENQTYLSNNLALPYHDKKDLEKTMRTHDWSTSYFPGKHFLTLLKLTRINLLGPKKNAAPISSTEAIRKLQAREKETAEAADMFLKVLASAQIDWTTTRVLVVDLNPKTTASLFPTELNRLLIKENNGFHFSDRIHVIDLKNILTPQDYYILDVHLTKQGNYKVGEHIAQKIRELSIKQRESD